MNLKRVFLSILAGMAFAVPAFCQRTMEGQSALEAKGTYNFPSFGGGLEYSRCLLGSYWAVGAFYNDHQKVKNNESIGYSHITVEGSWMARLVGTRSRSINLYGGGGAFMGVEMTRSSSISEDSATDEEAIGDQSSHNYLLWGLHARLQAEFFVLKRVALTVNCSLPVNFSSSVSNIHYGVGA